MQNVIPEIAANSPAPASNLAKAHELNSLAHSLRDTDVPRARSIAESVLSLSGESFTPAVGESPDQKSFKKAIGDALVTICRCDRKMSEFHSALECARKALDIFKEIGDQQGIAEALFNIGIVFKNTGDFAKALKNLNNALAFFKNSGHSEQHASCLMGIGTVHERLGNYSLALESYLKSIPIFEELNETHSLNVVLNNLGIVYKNLGDYDKAQEVYFKNLELNEKEGNRRGMGLVLNNIGALLKVQNNQTGALEAFKKAAEIFKGLEHKDGIASTYNNLGEIYSELGDTGTAQEYFSESIRLFNEIGNSAGTAAVTNNLGALFLKAGRYQEAETHLLEALSVFREMNIKPYLYEVYKHLSDLYAQNNDASTALHYFREFHTTKEEVYNEKNSRLINTLRTQHEISLLQKEQEVSDSLLLKILPASIAERLKRNENPIADYCENITVMFADIAGFTGLCEKVAPEELVMLLNSLFSYIDDVMQKHGIEKIKTIGDSYMAVAGAPVTCEDHCERIARAALEIQSDIHHNIPDRFGAIGIHFGIHTGSAISGVVGREKLAYDLWGDTINVAARMEGSGEIGKIHCTEEVFLKLQDEFEFEARGEIFIKGKGMMKTYFLVQKKAGL